MSKSVGLTFCSYKGGAGRTTTAVNVGYQLSRMGLKVVLVELDVTGPGLGSILDVADETLQNKGLSKFLLGVRKDEEVPPNVTDYVIPCDYSYFSEGETRNATLYLVGSPISEDKIQYPTENRSGLLPRMQQLDRELRKNFDVVIYDAPSGMDMFTVIAFTLADANCVCFRWSKQHLIGAMQILSKQFGLLEKEAYPLRDFFPIANAVAHPQAPREQKRVEFVKSTIKSLLERRVQRSLHLREKFVAAEIQYIWEFNDLKFEDKIVIDDDDPPFIQYRSLAQYIKDRLEF